LRLLRNLGFGGIMKFQDKWSRWHHKPIKDGQQYSSGNGWIYTAECKSVGLEVDQKLLETCFEQSLTEYGFSRHPDSVNIGISHDEVIGAAASLQGSKIFEQAYKRWEKQGWQICDIKGFKPTPWTKLNLVEVVISFYEIYKLDKLYTKTNGKSGLKARHATLLFSNVFPIAFHMNGWKRYLIKKHHGVRPSVYETMHWFLSKLVTVCRKDITPGKRILGFQLKLIKNKNIFDKILVALFENKNNLKEISADEYHPNHPILEKL
jgi:hypothetical protein